MRFKAVVMYDGALFNGWQVQPNLRTPQQEIEKALSRINKEEITIHGSGRTDSGVHALGQVFHFDSVLDLTSSQWCRAINALLPGDIRVLQVDKVFDEFHARYHAVRKTYIYRMNCGSYNLFDRNQVYQYCRPLDLETVDAVIACFLGEHDFTSFNATPLAIMPYQIRTIHEFSYTIDENIIEFKVVGSGFLRHMVRMMVVTCIAASERRITVTKVQEALDKPNKRSIPYNVPGCGLYLVKVDYENS